MKVAIYARVSSSQQAEKEISIPAQVKAIQQYCQERGYTIVSEYFEKGKSAKTDDRPEFLKMIALARRSNRPFEAIVVHKFDRFSRKRDDHVIYKSLLAKCGVRVLSVVEQTEAETPQDKLLEGMLEIMSEFFNANLALEVRKGMTQNAKQGYNNGGTPPYGYRTEHIAMGAQKTKAVWVLGPREEIDIVRFIFNQYAYENTGYKKISDKLNQKGVPTQKGGQWSASTIRAIIYNEAYFGRRCWNKQEYQTKGVKWRDRSEWIIKDNAHPAIISKELFDLCQSRAKDRHNGGGQTHDSFQTKPHSPFWLRGTMTCDKCSSRMGGNSTSEKMKGGKKQYYVCGGYLRKGKQFCQYVGWSKARVEEIVASRLKLALMRLIMNDNLEAELQQYYLDNNRHKIAQKTNLNNEIDFLLKRVELIHTDIQAGKAKAYHHEMLKEMQTELEEKQKELTAFSANYTDYKPSEEFIAATKYDIQTFLGLLEQDVPNVQLLHSIADKYISKLFINRNTKKLYLTVQIAHGNQVVYEKTIVSEWA